jgi:hypothetical protein
MRKRWPNFEGDEEARGLLEKCQIKPVEPPQPKPGTITSWVASQPASAAQRPRDILSKQSVWPGSVVSNGEVLSPEGVPGSVVSKVRGEDVSGGAGASADSGMLKQPLRRLEGESMDLALKRVSGRMWLTRLPLTVRLFSRSRPLGQDSSGRRRPSDRSDADFIAGRGRCRGVQRGQWLSGSRRYRRTDSDFFSLRSNV